VSHARFYLTETAFRQLDDIIYRTALDHGPDQAEKYKQRQLAGFGKIASSMIDCRMPLIKFQATTGPALSALARSR
jgi:hypothetical protein